MEPNKIARKLNIHAARAQAAEAAGHEPGITLEMDGGTEFTIPHPTMLDEDQQTRFDALRKSGSESSIELAKAIFGETGHAQYIAAGGRSSDIGLFWAEMVSEMQANPKLPR